MRVLVVGNGGREHAIIQSLKKSKQISKLFCLAGNGGIANDAEIVDMNVKDVEKVSEWAKENAIDFAVVATDDPLVLFELIKELK
jgi:phosphoribosylamine--glycine ligase